MNFRGYVKSFYKNVRCGILHQAETMDGIFVEVVPYWIEGTRISLDLIVYAFQKGLSPESIVQSFPLLTLEQVYGAIAFYLANRIEIDGYLVHVTVKGVRKSNYFIKNRFGLIFCHD
jgi:uncharacterized protein (DUF433 family)